MNWDAVGAIAELAGALGVIVTLLYLSSQLRHNTKALKSSTYQAYSSTAMSTIDSLSDNAEIAVKAGLGEELSQAEELRLSLYAAKLFSQMETIFLHYSEGLIDDEVFEARMSGLKKALGDGNTLKYWNIWKQYDLVKAFVRHVDENLIEGNT